MYYYSFHKIVIFYFRLRYSESEYLAILIDIAIITLIFAFYKTDWSVERCLFMFGYRPYLVKGCV